MVVLQRLSKTKTHMGKKVLLRREPQIIEGPKVSLFFQGRRSSERLRGVCKDFYQFRKPDAINLSRKNDITIFEDVSPVEAFCRKYEAALFVMASHSKKRPDNLVIGRMFDYRLLDMIELHIEQYKGLVDFPGPKITFGSKPTIVFNGPGWEEMEEFKHLKSIFIDMFHREPVDSIRLQGLEHLISFTCTPEKQILYRSYMISLKKSGCRTPRVEVNEIGPRIDMSLRRSKLPEESLMKEALKIPKELKVSKKKNISTDELGTTHGRIHVGKQQLYKVQYRKVKALRKTTEKNGAIKRKLEDGKDSSNKAKRKKD